MSNLSQLLEPSKRPAVIADLAQFVNNTVSSQSGITGMALKGAVAAAKKIDSNIVEKGMSRLLPDMLGEIEQIWQEFEASPSTDFGAYVEPRSDDVTHSIMKVADKHAQSINVAALAKTYNSLRGKASKIIEPNVPDLARLLQRHMQ